MKQTEDQITRHKHAAEDKRMKKRLKWLLFLEKRGY